MSEEKNANKSYDPPLHLFIIKTTNFFSYSFTKNIVRNDEPKLSNI